MSKSRKMHKNTLSRNGSISTSILPLWKFTSMGQMDVQERNLEILRRTTLLMPGPLPKVYGWHHIDRNM